MRTSRLILLVLLLVMVVAAPADSARGLYITPLDPPRLFLPMVTRNSAGPDPISPEALIDEAIASGALDSETGLVYKVFAIFGDTRLPSQYRATQVMKFGDDTMSEARVRFSTLSTENQALIQPYLLDPQDPGSWYMNRAQPASAGSAEVIWDFYDTVNGKVRVWFTDDVPDGRNKAQALRDAIDAKIWPALFEIMGYEPREDPNRWRGTEISLLPTLRAYGLFKPVTGCTATPGHIQINASYPIGDDATFGVLQIATHELMHAFQATFTVDNMADSCREYRWLAEATSNWAEDALYPNVNSERLPPGLPDFLKTPYRSINDRTGDRHYGAYTLLYLLTHTPSFPVDDPKKRIGQIWLEAESMNSIEAVDEVARTVLPFNLPGVFWSEFYRALWNGLPTDLYQSGDSLTAGARLSADDPNFSSTQPTAVELNGTQTKTYEMKGELRHSSSRYYHFTFPDATVRSVYLYDGILTKLTKESDWISSPGSEGTIGYAPGGPPTVGDPNYPWFTRGASFQALYKVEGQDWQEVPLNTPTGVSFCRDAKSERITDLVVILGNTDFGRDYTLQPPGEKPVLQVSNLACWQWTGTVTAQHEGGPNNLAWSATSTVTLRRAPTPPGLYLFAGPIPGYVLQSGQVDWIMPAQTQDGCTRSGSGTWTAAPGSETGVLRTVNGSLSGPWHRGHFVDELFEHVFTYQQQCPGSTTDLPIDVTWFDTYSPDTPDHVWIASSDGTQLSGTATTGSEGDLMTWTWSFVAEREP